MAKKPTEDDATPQLTAEDGFTPVETPKAISEEEISEKTRAGLTRAQAIEVITSQRTHDAALAKAKK